jgi:uncharacterized protein YndB with AHSA1/START domain
VRSRVEALVIGNQGETIMTKTLEYTYDIYGTRLQTTLKKGAPYAYLGDGDFTVVDGEILEVDPEKKLALSWSAHWDEASGKDKPSRVTYELAESAPGTTRLRLVHDQFDGETATYKGSADGWPLMLSSLKTLLESGRPLPSAQ